MRIINYFISSISSAGKVNYFESNFGKLKKTIHLHGYPRIVSDDIYKSIMNKCIKADFDVELIHNSIDNSISGIIIPEISTGIINFPVYDNHEYSITGLMNYDILNEYNQLITKAIDSFKSALKVHDNWEKIYMDNIDYEKLNSLSRYINEKIVGESTIENNATNTDRFFGASTIDGSVDYVPELSNLASKRYFIKGRPGSGKSTLLKKLRKNANENGFNTISYHCAFDPKSIDMIYIPKLEVCIFDSTAPHEYFPQNENDEIIDVYKSAITDGTDEKYYNELTNIKIEYSSHIKIGTKYIIDAYKAVNKLERRYIDEMNYSKIKSVSNSLISEIFG